MFDLKYYDKLRKNINFKDTIDTLKSPMNSNKILNEIRYMNKKEAYNYLAELAPSTDVVINNQIMFQLYGEKAFTMPRNKILKLHYAHNMVPE